MDPNLPLACMGASKKKKKRPKFIPQKVIKHHQQNGLVDDGICLAMVCSLMNQLKKTRKELHELVKNFSAWQEENKSMFTELMTNVADNKNSKVQFNLQQSRIYDSCLQFCGDGTMKVIQPPDRGDARMPGLPPQADTPKSQMPGERANSLDYCSDSDGYGLDDYDQYDLDSDMSPYSDVDADHSDDDYFDRHYSSTDNEHNFSDVDVYEIDDGGFVAGLQKNPGMSDRCAFGEASVHGHPVKSDAPKCFGQDQDSELKAKRSEGCPGVKTTKGMNVLGFVTDAERVDGSNLSERVGITVGIDSDKCTGFVTPKSDRNVEMGAGSGATNVPLEVSDGSGVSNLDTKSDCDAIVETGTGTGLGVDGGGNCTDSTMETESETPVNSTDMDAYVGSMTSASPFQFKEWTVGPSQAVFRDAACLEENQSDTSLVLSSTIPGAASSKKLANNEGLCISMSKAASAKKLANNQGLCVSMSKEESGCSGNRSSRIAGKPLVTQSAFHAPKDGQGSGYNYVASQSAVSPPPVSVGVGSLKYEGPSSSILHLPVQIVDGMPLNDGSPSDDILPFPVQAVEDTMMAEASLSGHITPPFPAVDDVQMSRGPPGWIG